MQYVGDGPNGVRSGQCRPFSCRFGIECSPGEGGTSGIVGIAFLGSVHGGCGPESVGEKEVTGSTFLNEMIGCGLIKYVDQMKERQWTDPDIVDDLDVLYKLLHENFKEMSTWDVYLAEVKSGSLEFGFLHTEKFFKENAKKFEGPDGDFYVVKVRRFY